MSILNIQEAIMPTSSKPKKKPDDKVYEIIVNGEPKTFAEKKISFAQVVQLAFGTTDVDGNIAYTITYKRGENQKPKGVMVKGDVVTIKKGMVFNVTATDQS